MPSKKKEKKEQAKTNVEKKMTKRPFLYLFSVIILVIVVVTFVGAPLLSNLAQQGRMIFGKYGKEEITFYPGNYLSRQKDIIADQMRSSMENQNQNVQLQAYRVWRAAFERTVVHTAILQETENAGVHISDDRIDQALTEYGPYVRNGEFQEDIYRNTSNSERYTNRKLFRQDLFEQQYREDLSKGYKYSTKEMEFITSMASPERSFQFIEFQFEDFPDEQVLTYGKNNSELFRHIKLSRITITSNAEDANTVLSQLKEDPSRFEELARTQSEDAFAEKGGDMGWRRYYSMEPDFESREALQNIFNLEINEISDVVKTSFGWAIYRCDQPSREPDFSNTDTVEEVRYYMERYERGMIEDFMAQKANGFISETDNTSFAAAAEDFDKEILNTGFFPINYGNAFFLKPVAGPSGENQQLQSAAYREDFFRVAFSTPLGEAGEPIVLEEKVVVMQPKEERNPPDSDVAIIESYYTYILQQFQQEETTEFYVNSDKLVDNFNTVFSEYFMRE